MVPSFKWSSHEDDWDGMIFAPLLMRHGPPPKGVKWYGNDNRPRFTSMEARKWQQAVSDDCRAAVEAATPLTHYKPMWRERHALNIKNRFIRWCRDG